MKSLLGSSRKKIILSSRIGKKIRGPNKKMHQHTAWIRIMSKTWALFGGFLKPNKEYKKLVLLSRVMLKFIYTIKPFQFLLRDRGHAAAL